MNQFNILIVDDESLVAMELASSISDQGYNVVDYATNSRMAKRILDKHTINLILMDINLGEMESGIDLYKSLNKDIPIVYLTAYSDDATIADAMSTEPLGYLVKPHKEEDLKAILKLAEYKIENKAAQNTNSSLVDLGEGYFFNLENDQLLFEKLHIKLTLKELKLMKLIMSAKGEIVDYDTIEKHIWGDEEVNNASLRTLVYRLRNKLEHKLIENEYSLGLKLKL